MKNIFIFTLLLAPLLLTAQSNIDSLRYELSHFKSGERYGDKIALARTLHDIEPFDSRGVDYICRYYYDRNIDSVSIFLDKIIETYPDSIEAYILKAEHLNFIRNIDTEQQKSECLKQAYEKDSLNFEVNYMLAELYYDDFLKPYFKFSWGIGIKEDNEEDSFPSRPVKKNKFDKPENQALFYLNNLKRIKPELEKIVFFPIQQIQKYKDEKWIAPSPSSIDNDCYFPMWYFINLKEGWEKDLSRDYLFELGGSPSGRLSYFLELIDEPCLYNNDSIEATEVFRFTWLRTFHNPICLRVERINDCYTLYWKLLDGAGGYDYGKLKISKSKNISKAEWDTFKNLFDDVRISELPNREYVLMTDGATWTLEYKTPDTFKAHDTNDPSRVIIKCCTYLLNLTNLKIAEDDIY